VEQLFRIFKLTVLSAGWNRVKARNKTPQTSSNPLLPRKELRIRIWLQLEPS